MKISFHELAVIQILILLWIGPVFGQGTDSQMPGRATRSLVSIVAYDGQGRRRSSGSGFFINTTGDITTNHHVLAGCEKAIIETYEGKSGVIIEIIGDDPKLDLTVARTSIRDSVPLLLGDSDKVGNGDDIVVLGDSPGGGKVISVGIIKRMREAEGIKLLEITASIRPGRSGAPVLDSTGMVIGIATAFLDYGLKNNFAMPVNYLKTLPPTQLKLRSLPKSVARFDAVLKDETFIEVQAGGTEMPGEYGGSFGRETQDEQRGDREIGPVEKKVFMAGTVYFKNGKQLVCERAWKQGKNIYLQAQNKEIVVSYDENEIDMERSFNRAGVSGKGD
jgi:S1-C subfamily serine protease